MKLSSVLLFLSGVAAAVGGNCGFDDCKDGLECCDFGFCYNKSVEVCSECKNGADEGLRYPCPLDKPTCCASAWTMIQHYSCYGEGQKCCTESGQSANNSDFCIGSCGVTSDPFTKCCVTTEYNNRTQCCSGKGVCDVAKHTCNSCGCIERHDRKTQCCGAGKFDSHKQQCCGSNGICDQADTCSGCGCLSGPEMKCCGTTPYNTTAGETCCSDGSEFDPDLVCSGTQTCHAWAGFPAGQICCPKNETACTLTEGYVRNPKCMDPSTSICCTGAVCSKTLGSTCCDGKCCA